MNSKAECAFWRGFIKASALLNFHPQPFKLTGQSLTNLVNSIYWAEGGPKTKHPYGIMEHLTNTTPRQVALNTVTHDYHNWTNSGSHGDFLKFLQKSYSPINATNDPQHLNANWLHNVKHIMHQYQSNQKP